MGQLPNGVTELHSGAAGVTNEFNVVQEFNRRFDRIQAELGKLRDDLNGVKDTMNRYLPLIDRVDADMYNHGKDGLKTQFDKFVSDHKATEKARELAQQDRHAENKRQLEDISLKVSRRSMWAAIIAIPIGLAGLALAALTLYAMIWLSKHSVSDVKRMMQSSAPELTVTMRSDTPPY